MTRLLGLWQMVRSSLWFVPGVLVLLAVLLAEALIEIDSWVGPGAARAFPVLFGAGASGSRGLLETLAASMITVAGVVFSITLVALSLASSQYSSRVLRNFMRDRMNQIVLGVFVGIFAYCLAVLRTIREGDENSFVPSLAVFGGVVLTFVGIGYFIYFIHHIATQIQASQILARIASETARQVDRLFPDEVGREEPEGGEEPAFEAMRVRRWAPALSKRTGYLQFVASDPLLEFARERDTVVRMERAVGEFVVEGQPLVSVLVGGELSTEDEERLLRVFTIGAERSGAQDAAFGMRQMVDVALKALSPGINDTTTAVMAVDYLGAVLVRLSARRIESRQRFDGGRLRVLARGPTYGELVCLAHDQIRQHAGGNVAVLSRMAGTLEMLEGMVESAGRRRVLLEQALALEEVVMRSVPSAFDRDPLGARVARLVESLRERDARG
ncbi:MAG: DUF2254 domain-containing protein [Phycisphaerales bacterium]